MTELSLRPANDADVPHLTVLVSAAYGHYVTRIGGLPRPMIDDYSDVVAARRVTVAERSGEIVVLIVLDVDAQRLVIDNVAVSPAHQGQGVGRALLEHAEADARDAGLDWICLYTHERMTENLALYARIGYVEYDPHQPGHPRLVHMRKKLG